eukprot:3802099-Pyramimonas_sp.AAC.1
MGLQKRGSGSVDLRSGAIGIPTLERTEDGAGALFRAVLEEHRLLAGNTVGGRSSPTFFGDTYSSRIDYLSYPADMDAMTITCGTIPKLGAKLQLQRGAAPRDHLPL